MLTAERLRELFDYDPETGLFARKAAGAHNAILGVWRPGTAMRNGYRVFNVGGKTQYAHRMAWLYIHGELPPRGVDLDHINRNKSDNRIANLRLLSRVENSHNRAEPKHNTSGRKGVYWCKTHQQWIARFQWDGKQKSLGYFATFDAAVAARVEAERRYLGG
jgi:hypothetical protein